MTSACGSLAIDPSPCLETPPACVLPPDGCDAPASVAPSCDVKSSTWSCPAGARVHRRLADDPAVCLPFHDPEGPIRQLGGSLVRLPIDGGRCLWVGEQVETAFGSSVRNLGFEADLTKPFGSCPLSATLLSPSVPVVTIEGPADPSLLVQIDGGYRLGGETRVLYRLFRQDKGAAFGVTELGSGLGRWDPSSAQIIVPGPASLSWQTNLDLGDASRVIGGVPYVWGCHGPTHFLTNSCDLARLDTSGVAQLFAGAGGWVQTQEVGAAVTVFDSGPWVSSVVPWSTGFLHVYAVGFGSTLETHVSPTVTGPWTSGSTLAACDLPGADRHAFCAGPVVHEELRDPTRPGETVVSYGLGTTAENQTALLAAHPDDYWTRLVWVP
jgi:hypothetical protein